MRLSGLRVNNGPANQLNDSISDDQHLARHGNRQTEDA